MQALFSCLFRPTLTQEKIQRVLHDLFECAQELCTDGAVNSP